jgi:phosphatidylglycerophosphate synthase
MAAMTYNGLRQKCKRESDYIITLFITNEVSLFFTWLLFKTRITPNQVTAASIVSEFICACFYAFGYFPAGSAFYFLAHVLDCTDGNLARAKGIFHPLGRWLDFIGDRIGEVFIFLGICVYFYQIDESSAWITLTMLNSILILLYYYIVDIGLSLGISSPKQELTSKKFKDVHVKWGLYEPVMYGLIILPPFGLLKHQLVMIFVFVLAGFAYQIYQNVLLFKSIE